MSCPHGRRRSVTRVRFAILAPLEILGDEGAGSAALFAGGWNSAKPTTPAGGGLSRFPGSEWVIECDLVVVAQGTRANPVLTSIAPHLKLDGRGDIEVDAHGLSSMPGVFAGAIVRGSATEILAVGDAKRAAHGDR